MRAGMAKHIVLTPNNPIPFIPFPLIRGRGIGYIREAPPPFDSLLEGVV
jgi:hypothetical protein